MESYPLTPVQCDAILRMTLGQLVNLEQEKLAGEHHKLLADIGEFNRILSDERNIYQIIRDDLTQSSGSTPTSGGPRSAAKRSATSTWTT